MSNKFDEFDVAAITLDARRSLLKRYEWLLDFVMPSPDCAAQGEQRELWRRIELLRASLETPQPEILSTPIVVHDEAGEVELPF